MLHMFMANMGVLKEKNVITEQEYNKILETLKDKAPIMRETFEGIVVKCLKEVSDETEDNSRTA